MTKHCVKCGDEFTLLDKEEKFLRRMDVLDPVQCPICREQRRLAWRNEKNLYLRNCGGCNNKIVSVYSPDKNYKVYCRECWWSDKWDPLDVGRDFDFSRPFFEQFEELMHDSKLIALFGKNNQNSDYVNQETDDKNCYMNAGGHYNEDCYYNTYSLWGKDNVDNYWVIRSELLYECIRCEKCFSSSYLLYCEECTDCHYCLDCKGCRNCFGSTGLRHKEFYFFNKPLSQGEYEKAVAEYLYSSGGRNRALEDFSKASLNFPRKACKLVNCINCTGDDLVNCKNITEGYVFENSEDCMYAYVGLDVKDGVDLTSFGWGEVLYNCANSVDLNHVMCVTSTTDLDFSSYCFTCNHCSNLFGCVGLHRKEYCILNKQYSPGAYKEIVNKIIEHMKERGEYGQFFPPSISPFGYNETVANEWYPLEREVALAEGFNWKDVDNRDYGEQTYVGSYEVGEISEDVVKSVLVCCDCKKNYKVIAPEFEFYVRMKLPLPTKCLDCRHKRRIALRNPRQLWDRNCDKCFKKVKAPYKPGRPEKVYCEECYLQAVY